MPFAVDEDKMTSASMQVMDIGKPPLKQIPHMEFPKMVYLHPKDKTKEHRTKVVKDRDELDAALKQGWRKNAHVPVAPPDPQIAAGEFETGPIGPPAIGDLDSMTKQELIGIARDRNLRIDLSEKKEVFVAAIKEDRSRIPDGARMHGDA